MKTFWSIMVTALLLGGAFWGGRATKSCQTQTPIPEVRIDTVVVRDTIRDTVLVPKIRETVRIDTVWVKVAGDTVSIETEIPIERKTYQTADYRAVIEGFRPALTELEIYRNTLHIDRETVIATPQKPRRWGIGIHAGYGITTKGAAPYIGVGVQYNLIAW